MLVCPICGRYFLSIHAIARHQVECTPEIVERNATIYGLMEAGVEAQTLAIRYRISPERVRQIYQQERRRAWAMAAAETKRNKEEK